jgi:glycosyltransferase involved in cell wall biosynthesis
MRIAFVSGEYVTEEGSFDGGLANYIHRTAISLAGMGHEPVVFVLSDRDETLRHDGIEVRRVRSKRRKLFDHLNFYTLHRCSMALELSFFALSLRAALVAAHREKPFSIVQYPHLGGFALFNPSSIPSVVRLSSYTPYARERGGYDGVLPRNLRQQEAFENRGMKRAGGVFGPSRLISSLVERDIGRHVEVIESPFVIDVADYDDSLYREALAGSRYLLFVGSLNVLKGVVTIAEAIPGLLAAHPGLRFVFVGKERDGYRGMSMREYVLSRAGGFGDRVHFFPKMRHDRLYPVIGGALAVVLPSRIDNFPNVCLEAMAHRRVVVGTHGTSFEQLLTDGESGFLCEPDDPASLAAAVERAIALPDAGRAAMGERAFERVSELRPERVVAQLLSYYQKVISGKADK